MASSLAELEEFADLNLPKDKRDFLRSGANQEQTVRDNIEAFKRIRFCPRFLIDVSERDLSTTVLGHRISFPVCIAPSSTHCFVHPDGEVATAKAAASMNTVLGLSSWSTKSMEEVADAAPNGIHWYSLQLFADGNMALNMIRRAEKSGYKALLITVDTPIVGTRLANVRNKFQMTCRYPNFEYGDGKKTQAEASSYGPSPSAKMTWDDVVWLKRITKLPIILKGILTAADARLAVEHGAAGIVVSNHGGRQLDGVLATIDALPEVVEAVKGSKVEVYLDGGIRQGTDVLKALALGARAVFIGRPVQWGLCYKGEEGVKLVLELLKSEFSLAMALSGCTDARRIPRSIVRRLPETASRL